MFESLRPESAEMFVPEMSVDRTVNKFYLEFKDGSKYTFDHKEEEYDTTTAPTMTIIRGIDDTTEENVEIWVHNENSQIAKVIIGDKEVYKASVN